MVHGLIQVQTERFVCKETVGSFNIHDGNGNDNATN